MALNLDIKGAPPAVKIILAFLPAVILTVAFYFVVYSPKSKEITTLNAAITKLDKEILDSEVKVRRLDALKAENERLKARLKELQEQLPEEKEVSGLLKQVSDLGLESGLEILLWKPGAKKADPSGLYMEIPVSVELVGDYHNLGVFFSHVSRLKRIVNISNIKLGAPKAKKGTYHMGITCTATTFSSLKEEEKPAEKPGAKPKPAAPKPGAAKK
ncbi:MAG: type 4a pilus biogenesis protein PilO [Nitrospirae bacterium]|nr:type 4a pilus biogenesis protein PilO [Nitrospirota bacterium]